MSAAGAFVGLAHTPRALPRALSIGAVVGGATAGSMLLSEYQSDTRRSTREKQVATGALVAVVGVGLVATAKLARMHKVPVAALPAPPKLAHPGLPFPFDTGPLPQLNSHARSHILKGGAYRSEQGVKFSGGHRHGTGLPGKSEFPASWSDEKILQHISDVATDRKSVFFQRGGAYIATGSREGVDVEVVIRNGRIVTGFPTNTPKNPRVTAPRDTSVPGHINRGAALRADPNIKFAGGHGQHVGTPGMRAFPAGWSDDKILQHVSDVASDPKSTFKRPRSGQFVATGSRDGVHIEVSIKKGRITAAAPTNQHWNP